MSTVLGQAKLTVSWGNLRLLFPDRISLMQFVHVLVHVEVQREDGVNSSPSKT